MASAKRSKKAVKEETQSTTFNSIINTLESNKLLVGVVALLVNIGSRYIEIKFTPAQESILRNIAREVFIFLSTFLWTRDLVTSFVVTAAFLIMSNYIFNEDSKFCILPENLKKSIDINKDGIVSNEEIENAKNILDKAKKQTDALNKMELLNNFYQ